MRAVSLLLLCLAAIAPSLALPAAWKLQKLQDDGDFHFAQCAQDPVFNVSGVAISPNPAVHGQDIYVTLSGANAREVTAAKLTVTIYYRGWPVQRQTRDICGGPRPVTPPCPFEPGNLTITSSDAVPLLAPVGPYSMRMQAWDQGGDGVMCVDLWFHVVASSAAGTAGGGSRGGGSSGGIGSGVGGASVDGSSSSSGGGGGGGGDGSSQWRQQHHQQQQQTRQMRVGARQQSQQLLFTAAT